MCVKGVKVSRVLLLGGAVNPTYVENCGDSGGAGQPHLPRRCSVCSGLLARAIQHLSRDLKQCSAISQTEPLMLGQREPFSLSPSFSIRYFAMVLES